MAKTSTVISNGHRSKVPRRKNSNGKQDKELRKYLAIGDEAPSDHHIVPSSRMHEPEYEMYIGKSNLSKTGKGKHNVFHHLFFNLTPPEVIALLVKDFWNGQRHWVDMYLTRPDYYDEMMEQRKELRKNDKRKNHKSVQR